MKIIIKQRVQFLVKGCSHRRRINTEEKAKVVAAAWGTELTPFLAALAIFLFFIDFFGANWAYIS